MKNVFPVLILLFLSQNLIAQRVFPTDADYKADYSVFEVDRDYKADLLVHKVDRDYKAHGNKGLWHFADREYQADFTIFMVDREYQADLKVFFVDSEYKAGWRNNSLKNEIDLLIQE
mgnify:CR=1 FL=1